MSHDAAIERAKSVHHGRGLVDIEFKQASVGAGALQFTTEKLVEQYTDISNERGNGLKFSFGNFGKKKWLPPQS